MKRIAILVHDSDVSFGSGSPVYALELLMHEWQRTGFDVVIVRGTDRFMPADVLIPHLDMTVIPESYRLFAARYPKSINERVTDISKSVISSNLLRWDDDYSGPVIVKTDRNYGGIPEAEFDSTSARRRSALVRAVSRIASRLSRSVAGLSPWRYVDHMNPGDYPVFPSLESVPRAVFKNKNLVVEKFLPEIDGDDYVLRYYYFFGDCEMCFLLKSKEKVIKFSNAFQVEETPIHPDVRAMRKKIGCLFGKMDYVVHDGRPIVFDLNRTPSYSRHVNDRLFHEMVGRIAKGIESVL